MEKVVFWLLNTIGRLLPRLPLVVQQRLQPVVTEWERALAGRLILRLHHDLQDVKLQIEQMNEKIKRLNDK